MATAAAVVASVLRIKALIFKTASETHVGEIYYVRVYSGSVKSGDDVYNATQDRAEKVSQIFDVIGKNRVDAAALTAGDIGIAVKLRNSGTNDTLCDRSAPIRIHPIKFPSPIIDYASHSRKVFSIGFPFTAR